MKNLLLIPLLLSGMILTAREIAPDAPEIRIDGCAFRETIQSGSGKSVRMNRKIPHPEYAQWENPGAVIRFRTDAKSIRVRLRPNPLFPRKKDGTEDKVLCRIIGKNGKSRIGDLEKGTQNIRLEGDGSMREYEIVLPLHGAYDFQGIGVGGNPRFQKPKRKRRRIVFYGDDPVCGKAGSVRETIPFQVAERNGWDIVNMGFPRILLTPWHAEFLAEIPMNALVVLIGNRDAEFGTTAPVFRKNLERFIAEIRKRKPSLKLFFIAPFQCAGNRKLNSVRNEILHLKGENLHILDGASLIPSDPSYFEPDRKNLNGKGVRLFSENIAKAICF